MVVCQERNKFDDLVHAFLNEGLKKKQFCVYSSVNLDHSVFEKMLSNIMKFEDNIKNGNLLMVDLRPYLVSVMSHDLTPFKNLKKSITKKIRKRFNKNVRIYGDLTSHLFENNHYEECFFLEKWLQKNPFEGTEICPFQHSRLETSPVEKRRELFDYHDDVLVC